MLEFGVMGEGSHGQMAVVALSNAAELGKKVDEHLRRVMPPTPEGTYPVPLEQVRFSNGEGKIKLKDTVRGKDVYILSDIGNYSCTYQMFGFTNHMGPDEHFQDIKRAISAIGGTANRVTLMMPMLYQSRQHKRNGRESLDCAMALQELQHIGVSTLLSFDVHDPTIQNAVPLVSFENFYPTYTVLKQFLLDEGTDIVDSNLLVVSPDSGAMDRAIYFSGVLGVDVGMFYKRRNLHTVVNGRNPIAQHEYLGTDVEGKNVLIVDDLLASGESVLDTVRELNERGAAKIFVMVTFGQFTSGPEKFDALYAAGKLTGVYCTNLTYVPPHIQDREWFRSVDMSKYIAKIFYCLNHDHSIAPLRNAKARLKKLMQNRWGRQS